MGQNRLVIALLFVVVPWLALQRGGRHEPAVDALFARIRHECDPANPEADYAWSQRSMPTERNREAIIEDFRRLGPAILPAVHREMAHEPDAEVHGMLIVAAAALGDGDSLKRAGQEMARSAFPAVRISAAKTLRRLQDPRAFEWFLSALNDEHYVVNGGCGSLRERFYPVRSMAHLALREIAARHPEHPMVKKWGGHLALLAHGDTFEDLWGRMMETRLRQADALARDLLRQQQGP
jgi:hypothetical protein